MVHCVDFVFVLKFGPSALTLTLICFRYVTHSLTHYCIILISCSMYNGTWRNRTVYIADIFTQCLNENVQTVSWV